MLIIIMSDSLLPCQLAPHKINSTYWCGMIPFT